MSGTNVILYAFDPIHELEGRSGIVVVERALAERLIAEHRAESMETHRNEAMRYVTGSAANLAAAASMRDARGLVPVRRVQVKTAPARKTPRLER